MKSKLAKILDWMRGPKLYGPWTAPTSNVITMGITPARSICICFHENGVSFRLASDDRRTLDYKEVKEMVDAECDSIRLQVKELSLMLDQALAGYKSRAASEENQEHFPDQVN